MPQLRSRFALVLALAACGGGGKKTNPDAAGSDAAPDAPRVCASLTPMTTSIDILNANLTGSTPYIIWGGPGGDAGDGNPLTLQFEFYGGIESSLAGTFDLSQGNQTDYAKCAICVHAYSVDAQGNPIKQFFQSGGSVTLTEDPFTHEHMIASFSNVTLQEVTIDQNTFASTPVAGGLCTSYGSFTADHDKVPNAYMTCAKTTYQDGTACDCQCGGGGSNALPDPDCVDGNLPVNGCTTGQICYGVDDTCQTAPLNDKCAAAVPVTIGTPVTGTTVNSANNYASGLQDMTSCTGFTEQGPDVAYSVVLTAGQSITVTLSGLDTGFDGAIALLGPGTSSICDASPITTCVKGADANAEGMNETFTYTTDATNGAGTYYVLVDSFYPNEAGAFTLSVTSP